MAVEPLTVTTTTTTTMATVAMFSSLTPQCWLQRPQTLGPCVKHSHMRCATSKRAPFTQGRCGLEPRTISPGGGFPPLATRLSPFTSRRGNQIIKCEKRRQEEEVCVCVCVCVGVSVRVCLCVCHLLLRLLFMHGYLPEATCSGVELARRRI